MLLMRLIGEKEQISGPLSHCAGAGVREGGLMCETQRTVEDRRAPAYEDPCIRAENEDDDGYDPYSDRRPDPEPLFERDPWA